MYNWQAMKALTREQIREIDRAAIEDYGIPGVVLMENAGRNAARLIVDYFQTWHNPKEPQAEPVPVLSGACANPSQPAVCIFCGSGNNGGDGFVIARHLCIAEFQVEIVLLADPDKLAPDASVNYNIVRKMGIPIQNFSPDQAQALIAKADVIIDALLGTGFAGQVRPPMDRAVELINIADHALKVAIDVPSGLDCNSGKPAAATVKADLTITFVAPKVGFASAAEYTGKVLVADIGAPLPARDPGD